MRNRRHTTASALCMTVFEQMCDLVAVFAVDGHLQRVTVLLGFLGCPATLVASGSHRSVCRDLILDGGRSLADKPSMISAAISSIDVIL